eukprot:2600563-Pleurochrysis_carterae.AAC.2
MQESNNTDSDNASTLTCDSPQPYFHAWLDDLANWLPAQHLNYAPLVEFAKADSTTRLGRRVGGRAARRVAERRHRRAIARACARAECAMENE